MPGQLLPLTCTEYLVRIMDQPTVTRRDEFVSHGLAMERAAALAEAIEQGIRDDKPEATWRRICNEILTPQQSFEAHLRAHEAVFANWDASK